MIIPGMSWKLQNIFLWFLEVSWIGKRSKIYFLKFYKSWNVLESSKYFSMSFKFFGIARRSKITFLKFDKSWNVLEPSKYFSIIFKSLLDCQMVKNIFLEVFWIAWRLGIIFLKFDKSRNVLEPSKYFLWFLKASWIA